MVLNPKYTKLEIADRIQFLSDRLSGLVGDEITGNTRKAMIAEYESLHQRLVEMTGEIL